MKASNASNPYAATARARKAAALATVVQDQQIHADSIGDPPFVAFELAGGGQRRQEEEVNTDAARGFTWEEGGRR